VSRRLLAKGPGSIFGPTFPGVLTLRGLGSPAEEPQAREAASPALVRSRISSRSISASAAMPWKKKWPVAVPVSMLSDRLQHNHRWLSDPAAMPDRFVNASLLSGLKGHTWSTRSESRSV
jgi:hypothetical protein